MALVTKKTLYENVAALVEGGDPSTGAKYEKRMVEAFIQQAINKRLRIGYSTVILPEGETIPDGLVLACYDQIPVTTYKNLSRAKLPAMPISLRRQMGVFFVGPAAAGNISVTPTSAISVITIEGFIGSAFVVTGTTNTVTGLTAGSQVVTCTDFTNRLIDYVVRGNLLIPGLVAPDTYFTKDKASASLTFSAPLQPGEYIKIKTIDTHA